MSGPNKPFVFFDQLRPAGDEPIRVLARIHVIPTIQGERCAPYRPNHNFGDAENRHFFIGQVEVPDGEWIRSGTEVIALLP